MSELTTIQVFERKEFGKGPSRRIRRKGLIPAVVYAQGVETKHFSIDPNLLRKAMDNPKKRNTVLNFKFENGEDKLVMLKDYQLDPIKSSFKHIDFMEVHYDKPLSVDVPVETVGEAKGVIRGGILNIVRHVVTVECLPKNIPEKIVVDVKNLDIGNALHVKDIPVGEGLKLVYDVNFTVITVNAPTSALEEKAAAPAEGAAAAAATPAAAGKADDKAKAPEKGKK